MPSMRRRQRKSDCPIHFALEIFGDAWTLLIIRDLTFKGRITYIDFLHAEEGIATNVLADRLVRLEEDGVVQKEAGFGRGAVTCSLPRGLFFCPLCSKSSVGVRETTPRIPPTPSFLSR